MPDRRHRKRKKTPHLILTCTKCGEQATPDNFLLGIDYTVGWPGHKHAAQVEVKCPRCMQSYIIEVE